MQAALNQGPGVQVLKQNPPTTGRVVHVTPSVAQSALVTQGGGRGSVGVFLHTGVEPPLLPAALQAIPTGQPVEETGQPVHAPNAPAVHVETPWVVASGQTQGCCAPSEQAQTQGPKTP
jgi:hypothetical protein